MKILVVEDDYFLLSRSFEYLNTVYFGGALEIVNVEKSQDIRPIESVQNYYAVFVDVSLHAHSQMDGYSLIKTIQSLRLKNRPKIFLLTGSDNIEQKLNEHSISMQEREILRKPVSFIDLKRALGVKE